MNEFERFLQDYEELKSRIDRYQQASVSDEYSRSDCRDIYSAIYSLEQRFNKKQDQLPKGVAEALSKFFESDVLYKEGIVPLRAIVQHVKRDVTENDGTLKARHRLEG